MEGNEEKRDGRTNEEWDHKMDKHRSQATGCEVRPLLDARPKGVTYISGPSCLLGQAARKKDTTLQLVGKHELVHR